MNDDDDDIRAMVRMAAMNIHVEDRKTEIMTRGAASTRARIWRMPVTVAAAIGAILVAVATIWGSGSNPAETLPPATALTHSIPSTVSAAVDIQSHRPTIKDCDATGIHHQLPDFGEGATYSPGSLVLRQFGSTSLVCWYALNASTPKAALASNITRPIAAFEAPRQQGGGVPEYWGLLSKEVARLRLVCGGIVVYFTPDGSVSTGRLLDLGPAVGFVSPVGIAIDHPSIELTAYASDGTQIDSRRFNF